MSKLPSFFDARAVIISALCAMHCLALPVLLITFPLLGASVLNDELFHQLLLWVIVPTSIIAVGFARIRHPDVLVLVLMVLGLLVLAGGALWAHDSAPHWVDVAMSLVGGALLAIGHVRNFKVCRA